MGVNYRTNFKTEGIHETLKQVLPLLNDVSKYMEDAKHGVQIKPELADIIVQLLTRFLRICSIYKKIQSDSKTMRGKANNIFKAMLFLDPGVKAHIEAINALHTREQQIVRLETRGASLMSQKYLDLDRENGVKNQNRALIMDHLRFGKDSPSWNSWSETHMNIRERFLKGLGTWLTEQSDQFRAWSDTEQPTDTPVLILQARGDSGKSFLSSQVIEYLVDKHIRQERSTGSNSQAEIAYFYFQRIEKNKTAVKLRTTIKDAVAALVWQLTERDSVYQKFVAGECKNTPFGTADEVWSRLVTHYPHKARDKKVFFFVLDGINQASYSEWDRVRTTLKTMVHEAIDLRERDFQVRLLITGTQEIFEGLNLGDNNHVALLRVSEKNHNDVKTYIDVKMKKIREELNTDDDRQKSLERLRTKLHKECKGDFLVAKFFLDSIARKCTRSHLEKMLELQAGDRSGLIEAHMSKLFNCLDDDGIEDFNDILACMLLMRERRDIEQLAAFLEARNPRKKTPRPALKEVIETKYGHIFEIGPGNTVNCGAVVEYCRSFANARTIKISRPVSYQFGPKIDYPKDSEMKKVQDVIEEDFKQSMEQWSRSSQGIQFGETDGNLRIIHGILRAVVEEEETDGRLHKYAAKWLPWHLHKIDAKRLLDIDEEKRADIRRLLWRFFMEETCVKRWLKSEYIHEIFSDTLHWVDSEVFLEEVLEWLKDDKVGTAIKRMTMEKLSSEVEDDQQKDTQGRGTTGVGETTYAEVTAETLLRNAVNISAQIWLQEVSCEVLDALECFRRLSEVCAKFSDWVAPMLIK